MGHNATNKKSGNEPLMIHDDLGRLIGYLTRDGIVRLQPKLH